MAKTRIGETSPIRNLQAHLHEAIKMHHTYDASNRLETVIVALATADDGDSALKTTYSYDGTSIRVVGMKEELTTWDSDWDI